MVYFSRPLQRHLYKRILLRHSFSRIRTTVSYWKIIKSRWWYFKHNNASQCKNVSVYAYGTRHKLMGVTTKKFLLKICYFIFVFTKILWVLHCGFLSWYNNVSFIIYWVCVPYYVYYIHIIHYIYIKHIKD